MKIHIAIHKNGIGFVDACDVKQKSTIEWFVNASILQMLIVCDLWKNEISWNGCALPYVMTHGSKHVLKRPGNERVDSMTCRRDRRRCPRPDFSFRDRRNFLCWLLGN